MQAQNTLTAYLKSNNVHWKTIEEQIWEISEYTLMCKVRPALTRPPATKDFKVYMYAFTGKERVKASATFNAIWHAVTLHLASTTAVDDASIYVPVIDTTCFCDYCTHHETGAGEFPKLLDDGVLQELRAIEYWDQGNFHVVFDASDLPCVPYEIGNAIAIKMGFTSFHYRPGFDVALAPVAQAEYTHVQRHVPPIDRKYLLTMRGKRSEHFDMTRKELYRIHNGNDIILVVTCESRFGDDEYDSECREDERKYQQYTDQELATGSKFALVTEGHVLNELKLVDVMSAGCIPVILYDHYVLPFNELLDWESFSIRVPEHQLNKVGRHMMHALMRC